MPGNWFVAPFKGTGHLAKTVFGGLLNIITILYGIESYPAKFFFGFFLYVGVGSPKSTRITSWPGNYLETQLT